MAYINLSGGLKINSPDAVDSRLVLSKAEMLNLRYDDDRPEELAGKVFQLPDNYLCVCKEDSRVYIYNVHNEEDPELGRFRAIEAGISNVCINGEPLPIEDGGVNINTDELTVGLAENLTPYSENSGATDTTPFIFQTSGGETDVSDFAYLRSLKGLTILWNQLVGIDTEFVRLNAGHFYITDIAGERSLLYVVGGQALEVEPGKDQVFDLTLMLPESLLNLIVEHEADEEGAGILIFNQLFPLPYYSFCRRSLRSTRMLGLINAGFNAFLGSDKIIPVIAGQEYTIENVRSGTFEELDGAKEWISTIPLNGQAHVTLSPMTHYVRIHVAVGSDVCLHLTWDRSMDGEYEEHEDFEYHLPNIGDDLRSVYGVYDELLPEGKYIKRVGVRPYEEGDENDHSVITDLVNTQYVLANEVVYEGYGFDSQVGLSDFGTQRFVSYYEEDPATPIVPQGNVFFYPADYKAFLDSIGDRAGYNADNIALTSELKQTVKDLEDGDIIVGAADRLTPYSETSGTTDATGFVFQTSGGDSDVGGNAFLRRLSGKTLSMNNSLVLEEGERVVGGITISSDSHKVTVSGAALSSGTVSLFSGNKPVVSLKKGHFYVLRCSEDTEHLVVKTATQKRVCNSIFKSTISETGAIALTFASGDELDFECYLEFIDVTKMFGAGNEPEDIYEFNHLITTKRLAISEGSFLSARSSAYEITGYNAFDIDNPDAFIEVVSGELYTIEKTPAGIIQEFNGDHELILETPVSELEVDESTGLPFIEFSLNTQFVKILNYVEITCLHLRWDDSKIGYEKFYTESYELPNIELRGFNGDCCDYILPTGEYHKVVDIHVVVEDVEAGSVIELPSMLTDTSLIRCSRYGELKDFGRVVGKDVILEQPLFAGDEILFKLETPVVTTSEDYAFEENTDIDDFGTQRFVSPAPQGNVFFYPVDYKAFMDSLGGRDDIDYDAAQIVSHEELDEKLDEMGLHNVAKSTINVTYDEAKALKEQGQLVPGQTYRITDYVTTTKGAESISAGHAFDLILTALDESTFSEDAKAVLNDQAENEIFSFSIQGEKFFRRPDADSYFNGERRYAFKTSSQFGSFNDGFVYLESLADIPELGHVFYYGDDYKNLELVNYNIEENVIEDEVTDVNRGYFATYTESVGSAHWINPDIAPEDIEILYDAYYGGEIQYDHSDMGFKRTKIQELTTMPNEIGVEVPAMLNPNPESSHWQNDAITMLYMLNSDEEIKYTPSDLYKDTAAITVIQTRTLRVPTAAAWKSGVTPASVLLCLSIQNSNEEFYDNEFGPGTYQVVRELSTGVHPILGVVVPVIYKESQSYLDDNPSSVDYAEPYYYDGVEEFDGTTYDRWVKKEGSEMYYGKYYLTNNLVNANLVNRNIPWLYFVSDGNYDKNDPDYTEGLMYYDDFILDGTTYNRWLHLNGEMGVACQVLTQRVVVDREFTLTQEDVDNATHYVYVSDPGDGYFIYAGSLTLREYTNSLVSPLYTLSYDGELPYGTNMNELILELDNTSMVRVTSASFREGITPDSINVAYVLVYGEDIAYEGGLEDGDDKEITRLGTATNPFTGLEVPAFWDTDGHGLDITQPYIFNGVKRFDGIAYNSWLKLGNVWNQGRQVAVEVIYEVLTNQVVDFEAEEINVPLLYKTDATKYGLIPDHDDVLRYVDDFELDGVLYNRWMFISGISDVSNICDSIIYKYILTQRIVENHEFTITQEELTAAITSEDHLYDRWSDYGGGFSGFYRITEHLVESTIIKERTGGINISSWNIKYCFDNDEARFDWAIDKPFKAIMVYDDAWGANCVYIRYPQKDREGLFAWCLLAEDIEFITRVQDWSNINTEYVLFTDTEYPNPGSHPADTAGESMTGKEDLNFLGSTHDFFGRGVIYYLKDDFSNEAPYDFKNIMFCRNYIDNSEFEDYPYVASLVPGEPTWPEGGINWMDYRWHFTFNYFIDLQDEERNIDLSLNSEVTKDFYHIDIACTGNLIKPRYDQVDSDNRGFGHKQYLNNIVFANFEEDDVGKTLCCRDNTFDSNCRGITVGRCSSMNRFGVSCRDIYLGVTSNYNSIGDDCYRVTICSSSTHVSLGTGCYNIYFGTSSHEYTKIGINCHNINIKEDQFLTIGDNCFELDISVCRNVSIGSYCSFLSERSDSESQSKVERLENIIIGSNNNRLRFYIADGIIVDGIKNVKVQAALNTTSSFKELPYYTVNTHTEYKSHGYVVREVE